MRTNSIKRAHGDRADHALQITEGARSANLVRDDGETEQLAECYVAAVHGLLVVVDVDVKSRERTELIHVASDRLYRVVRSQIVPSGNGYQIGLPNARDAGFEVGDDAPVSVGDRLLVIQRPDAALEAGASPATRAESLVALRSDQ